MAKDRGEIRLCTGGLRHYIGIGRGDTRRYRIVISDTTPLSDLERERRLLAEALAGLLAGEERLWRALQIQVARYVDHRYSASRSEREDLTADILRTLLENLRRHEFRGSSLRVLNGYIYGIARLKLMHAIRQARHNTVEIPADGEGTGQLAGGRSPDADVTSRELADKILAAVDPRSRELLQLKFLEGWSDQEIADHMNMTKNAVSTAICRAIQKAQTFDFVKGLLY